MYPAGCFDHLPLYELNIDKPSKPVMIGQHPDRLFGRLQIERERLLNEQQNTYAMIDAEELELERSLQWVMKYRRLMGVSR